MFSLGIYEAQSSLRSTTMRTWLDLAEGGSAEASVAGWRELAFNFSWKLVCNEDIVQGPV
jgi:hypothetical protein